MEIKANAVFQYKLTTTGYCDTGKSKITKRVKKQNFPDEARLLLPKL